MTLFVGVAAILVAAGRMAYLRRGEPVREAAHGLLRLVVVSGAGLAFISILAQGGDSFSSWVLSSTPGSQSGDLAQATTLFKLSGGGAFTAVPFLLLLLGIVAILATLIQLFLIIVRGALLVVMVGVWPLGAAASMTGAGQSMFKKTTGYILAFLIYKPAASIVYALAFYLLQNPPANADPIVTQIEGVVLIVLATLTLPALLKFVVPAVSSAGGIGAGEAIGAGAALATGAAAIMATGGGSAAAGAGAKAASAAETVGGPGGPPGASAAAGGGGDQPGGGGPPGTPGGDGGGPVGAPGGASGGGGDTQEMATSVVGGSNGAEAPAGSNGSTATNGAAEATGNGSGPIGGRDGTSSPGASGASTPGASPGGGSRSGGGGAWRAQQAAQAVGAANGTATGALERQMDSEEPA